MLDSFGFPLFAAKYILKNVFCWFPMRLHACTVCSEKIAPALDRPNEMPTYRIYSPLFSDRLTT